MTITYCVLDAIRDAKTISFSQLLEICPYHREDLKKELKRLLKEGKISKNFVIECPNCATSLGFLGDYTEGQDYKCIYCNKYFTFEKQNVKVFFFLK